MRGAKPVLVIDNGAIKRDQPAPKWMSADAKQEWKRVFPILRSRKILTVADLGSLENYCVAIGQVREMERVLQAEGHTYQAESGPKRHPATAIQSDAMTRARLLAAELGLTPVSRSRPAVRKDDDDDDPSWANSGNSTSGSAPPGATNYGGLDGGDRPLFFPVRALSRRV